MADRGATAAVVTELGASFSKPFHLYEAYFDSGTVYATDCAFPITYGGNLYVADGNYLGFDGLSESVEMQSSSVRIHLSGVSQTYISSALSASFIDRRLVIRKAFLNTSTGELLANPFVIFDGKMDAPSIDEDPTNGTSTVTLTASNQWVDFDRRAGRHTNHAEQQIHFSGDMFFEHVSGVAKEINWGGQVVGPPVVSPNALPPPSSGIVAPSPFVESGSSLDSGVGGGDGF